MMVFFWPGVRLSLSFVALGALALAAGAACGGDDGGDSGKVRVVTTLPLFADFVREVGGDRVDVTSLVPPGTDPHTFEPSPSDVKKVAEADIAFANGLDLEPAAEKLISANLKNGAPLVKLADQVRHAPATLDPHLWMNPDYASEYAKVIRDRLTELDPEHDETYGSNTLSYLDAIAAAKSDARTAIDTVPSENRWLVTTHDAFGRLANAFGLSKAFVVVSPGQEPSPEDVAHVVTAIKDQGVPAVFREPQLDSEGRILEQAAKDAGVLVCTLYSDSLDDKVKTYIEMMRFNAEEIARCLGGNGGG